jgi:hypothetical protein
MRSQTIRRALGSVLLASTLGGLLAACAAPPAPPAATGPVEGLLTKGGLVAVSGVVVRAQGKTTLTDADGRFVLEGITVPYDLSLSQTSGDGGLHVLEGLTDRTPVIDPLALPTPIGPGTTVDVSGALSGGAGAWPLPAGRRVVVCIAGLDAFVFGCDDVTFGQATYALTANLIDASASEVRLHALRMTIDGDGRPTGYEGYGSVAVAVEAGVPSVVPIVLGAAPPVGDLEVAFDVPGGAALAGAAVVLRFGDGGGLPLFEGDVAGTDLSLPVPVLPEIRYGVFAGVDAVGGSSARWAIVDGLDGGTVSFEVPAQLVAPAADATGVTTATPFDVVVASPRARTFLWSSAGGPDVALTTTRTSVTLPDPTAVGIPWPAGAAYTWHVMGYEAASVDAAASALDLQILYLSVYLGADVLDTGAFATTVSRNLTLAP